MHNGFIWSGKLALLVVGFLAYISFIKPPSEDLMQAGPLSSSKSSYSIWLETPTGSPLNEKLVKEMGRLAETHKGPRFAPHVTLVGGMNMTKDEAVDAAKRIAQQLRPYRIRFQRVGRGTFFFQCVFIKCEQDAATMEAAALAKHECGMEPGPYMPHLSLLYADLDDQTKEEVASASHSRLLGERASEDTRLPEQGFLAQKLSLWHTPSQGKPSLACWTKEAEFDIL